MQLPVASGGVLSGTRRRSNKLWRTKLRRSQPVFALPSPIIPAVGLRRTEYSGEDE